MFFALPLLLAFVLPSLHFVLGENVFVAEILALNEILEIQVNETITDVNNVVALNKTKFAAVRNFFTSLSTWFLHCRESNERE